jgi:hypothetical protein
LRVINRDGYVWYWYDEVPRYINSEDMACISLNMQTIKELLISKGYTVDDIVNVEAMKSTQLVYVYNILNNVEGNLAELNRNEIQSIYYGSRVFITDFASSKEQIKRWIDVLNDLFDILTGVSGKWGYLTCTDGYPTIENKRIILRGDKIG